MKAKKTSRSAPSVQSGTAKLRKKRPALSEDHKLKKPVHEPMPIPEAESVPLAEILKRKKTEDDGE